jgi:hypothetical protein
VRELCTYSDRNYLPQAIALYRSLERQGEPFRLWFLCLDADTRRIVDGLALEHVELVTPADLIEFDPRLEEARRDRPEIEFYYACTPALVRYAFDRAQPSQGVAYVDADMFFLRPVSAILGEAPHASVMIVAHNSNDEPAEIEHGRYNVCFLQFAATPEARRCLAWWSARTLESTKLGDGVWGDQKYLDEFEERFEGVHVFRDPGVGLAPWHFWARAVTGTRDEIPLVDGQPLSVYHFARFLVLSPHLFVPIRRDWLPRAALRHVYRPYMREIRAAYLSIREVDPRYRVGYTRHNRRGALLAAATGRVFYEGRLGFWRLGPYVPSGRSEVRSWHTHRRRFRAAASADGVTG